jgi:hypothetical protein
MERYMPQPMVQGNMLATWNILKDGLTARGIKDWQKILPPKEAIIQEMQRMAQEAQMQRGMPNSTLGQGNTPQGANPQVIEALKQKLAQGGQGNVGQPV